MKKCFFGQKTKAKTKTKKIQISRKHLKIISNFPSGIVKFMNQVIQLSAVVLHYLLHHLIHILPRAG